MRKTQRSTLQANINRSGIEQEIVTDNQIGVDDETGHGRTKLIVLYLFAWLCRSFGACLPSSFPASAFPGLPPSLLAGGNPSAIPSNEARSSSSLLSKLVKFASRAAAVCSPLYQRRQ